MKTETYKTGVIDRWGYNGRCRVVGDVFELDGATIRGGLRLYRSVKARRAAILALRAIHPAVNSFVVFYDVNRTFPFGLSFGHASWVRPGEISIQ